MGFKAFAFLVLLLAIVLLIASEVTARELADQTSTSMENTEASKNTNGVEEAKNPGGGFGSGGGFGGNSGGGFGGNRGGGNGNRGGGYENRGRRNGGGYCHYRCCRRNYYGRCYRCCSYLGEAVDKEIEGQPHN